MAKRANPLGEHWNVQSIYRGWAGLLATIGMACFFSSAVAYAFLGGGAERAEDGIYIVSDHGVESEVSREVWWLMRILEPTALAGFVLMVIMTFIGFGRTTWCAERHLRSRGYGLILFLVVVIGMVLSIVGAAFR